MSYRTIRFFSLLFAAAALCAAAGPADWSSLAGLKNGDIIEIRQSGRSTVTATYRSNTADALTGEIAGTDRTMPKSGITRISVVGKTHRVKHAVLLGLAGGLAGAASYKFGNGCAETDYGCSRARGVTSAGAAAGAIAGILWPAHKTVIYRVGK